jgi:hypothetical protein
MRHPSRRARGGPQPAPQPRGRFGRWARLTVLAALSTFGILFSDDPAGEAEAQPPAATAVKASGAVPGAGKTLTAPELARVIDEQIQRRLKAEGVTASPKADDAEFLRRVYLDLVGRIPPAEKVVAFLDSKEPDKRAKAVEELLADPRYGRWLAENWVNAMIPRQSNNRFLKSGPLQEWLAENFNKNRPWDKTVTELLTATGTQAENAAVTYFVGNNTVDKMTDSVTKLFLGVRLECAQCHNHPFTDYKRAEYWGMAQFFMKVRLAPNPKAAAKKGIAPGIIESNAKRKKKDALPDSAQRVPARFLQGASPKLDPSAPYRPVLAKWLASADNPFFARAMVNKMWGHLFGRGLVNPVDDMHKDNAPSHPELLAALTEQFKRHDFDVKYLVRAIVNSETYQRSSRAAGNNKADVELFSHAAVRALSPEQLYDSLTSVVGTPKFGAKKAFKAKAGKKGPVGPRAQFVNFFYVEGGDPLEYQGGIPQALRLMNSGLLNNTGQVVNQAVSRGGNSPPRVVEELYLAILSRRPTGEELERRLAYVRRQPSLQAGYGDLAWALLNCSEFALNH